jgi:hypothetical protein
MRSAVLALVLALPTQVIAQQVASADARAGGATPARIPVTAATTIRAPQAPKIDGKDDDAVWQTATRYSEFRTFEPTVDTDPRFRTEFRTSYDEKNLYVFVRMFDPHPDSILRALSRRDQRGPSDQIKLLIDSYNDKRSGYEFAVNPVGVKRDFSMSNDGNEDGSWDGVWDVATRIDEQGWTAEFQIPLSQMRYGKADSHTFGFGVWRDIERYKERTSWPLWNPKKSGLSSQLGTLSGLTGLSSDRRMEAAPYIVTKDQQRPMANGKFGRDQEVTVGADMKIGITPNITLDATVNPDFGQVEADPAVVNLSAFETFFSERRPFFIEGAGNYRFQLNCYIVVDCSTNEGLFYSRRIGRSPTLRGVYGDANTAIATPIAGATKLTGRTAGGLTFGLLDAYTPRVTGVNNQTVEPGTNYAVLRAQQDLNGGESGFSFIGTAVNRSLDNLSEPFLHKSAYAGGATYRNRFYNKQYEFNAQLAASRVEGTAAMIRRTQTNAVHYYQQPGDDLELDTTKTSLSGYEWQLKLGKYSGGITRFETSVVQQSAGFDVNDLGFLRRGDYTDWSTWAALSWREAKGFMRWAQVNGNHWIRYNTSGAKLDHSVNFNGHLGVTEKFLGGMLNNWDFHLGGTLQNITQSSCDRCTRGGPLVRNSAGFYPWGGFNTDSRKDISGGMWINYGRGDEGESRYISYSPYMNFRFGTRATIGLSLGYTDQVVGAQWFGNFTGGGATHYTFAKLDQVTVSTGARINYTATKDLTFEFYAAPFVSSGTYSDLRELSSTPDADKFDARYQPYAFPAGAATAFKFAQVRTNAVVRWEYRPGSTAFFVWQHGRQDSANQASNQTWLTDYRDLFDRQPDNTFLIKLAYWINK